MEEIIEKQCELCGTVMYIFKSSKKKYCDDCVEKRRIERAKRQSERAKENKRKAAERRTMKSLHEIMWELEEYNRKHKTCLSYGQYCNLTRNEKSSKI